MDSCRRLSEPADPDRSADALNPDGSGPPTVEPQGNTLFVAHGSSLNMDRTWQSQLDPFAVVTANTASRPSLQVGQYYGTPVDRAA
jgi:hypothetical protein